MDADECNARAAECAANAALSTDETVSMAFLRLAAQWRAMAVRDIFLGQVNESGGGLASLGDGVQRPLPGA